MSPTEEASARQTAQAVVADLAAGDLDAVERRFTEQMRKNVPRSQLQAVWDACLAANGPLLAPGEPIEGTVAPPLRWLWRGEASSLLDFPLRFERGEAHLQVVVDAGGRVAGLVLKAGPATGRFGR